MNHWDISQSDPWEDIMKAKEAFENYRPGVVVFFCSLCGKVMKRKLVNPILADIDPFSWHPYHKTNAHYKDSGEICPGEMSLKIMKDGKVIED